MRKAARLGVHTDAAERCWVSLTPSSARRSRLGVLRERHGHRVTGQPARGFARAPA